MHPIIDPECTCLRLRKASRIASRLYDKHLAPTGINLGQYSILKNLAALQKVSISELADKIEVERTTLTRNLAPLTRAGYVLVGEGANKRSKSVTLTEAGKQALASAHPFWRTAQLEIDEALGASGKERLHRELDSGIERLRAISA